MVTKMVLLPPCSFCGALNLGIHAMTPGLQPACHSCYKKITAKRNLEELIENLGIENVKGVIDGIANKQEKKD